MIDFCFLFNVCFAFLASKQFLLFSKLFHLKLENNKKRESVFLSVLENVMHFCVSMINRKPHKRTYFNNLEFLKENIDFCSSLKK